MAEETLVTLLSRTLQELQVLDEIGIMIPSKHYLLTCRAIERCIRHALFEVALSDTELSCRCGECAAWVKWAMHQAAHNVYTAESRTYFPYWGSFVIEVTPSGRVRLRLAGGGWNEVIACGSGLQDAETIARAACWAATVTDRDAIAQALHVLLAGPVTKRRRPTIGNIRIRRHARLW
jgi:hypothetical protein